MPGVVTYQRAAKNDLKEIGRYIERDNPAAAKAVIDRVMSTADLIAQNPAMGRTRDDLLPLLRSFPVDNYVLYYQPRQGGITVVRVLHSARDVARQFH